MGRFRSFIGSVFSHTLFLVNLGVGVWLILCYVASTISPAEVRHIALLSLTTPFAVFANIVFCILWLFSTRKLRSLFSLVLLIVCYQIIPAVFGIHYLSAQEWKKSPASFKLMSWNVHAMGTFNHPKEKEYAQGIMDVIKEESPDVLCMPEFAVYADSKRRGLEEKILKANGYEDYYFHSDNGYGPDILIGTAFFSRYPVVGHKVFEIGETIFLVQCDVEVAKGKIIRFCSLHLQSFGLSDKDKAFIEEVKQRKSEDVEKTKSFIWKFNEAYKERALEADKAAAIIEKSPYPVVVCGDFNDLPYSYTYSTIKGELSDAFAKKGRGFGRTYNQIIPTLRIDHIFYDPKALKIRAFKTLNTSLSDHSPILVNLEIMDKPAD